MYVYCVRHHPLKICPAKSISIIHVQSLCDLIGYVSIDLNSSVCRYVGFLKKNFCFIFLIVLVSVITKVLCYKRNNAIHNEKLSFFTLCLEYKFLLERLLYCSRSSEATLLSP